MLSRLRRLLRRPDHAADDPAAELERERRLARGDRDHDRMQDRVLETDQHYVTRRRRRRPAPSGHWPSR